jgi:uncharacterized protein YuzE
LGQKKNGLWSPLCAEYPPARREVMRFEFDPKSGAIYVRIRNGEIAETLEIADPGFGAYLDVDQEGNVLRVEFLSFKEFAELTTRS